MQNPQNPGLLARAFESPLDETLTSIPTPSGPLRARLYVPRNNPHPPGMVVVHGLHHLGIDEPRLVAFARSLSATGIQVLTPELPSLADYHIDRASADLIGYSARALANSVGRKVGVLGLSFAGGLGLIAAADPRFAPCMNFVVSVGAHDDLERVSQFLASNRIPRPDGSVLEMPAHEYGALILIYLHLEDFFPASDVPAARETLQLLLWERVEDSRKSAEQLSPASRQKMELLFAHHREAFTGEIEQAIARHHAEMAPVSPHGQLGGLQVPVFLLHGSEDNVIPPSELFWLKQDVPRCVLKAALISSVFSHVDMEAKSRFADTLQIVHFMAQVFEMTDAAGPITGKCGP